MLTRLCDICCPLVPAGAEQYNVRLFGGVDNSVGRMEIYFLSQWLPVCQEGWDREEAQVVCRQIEHPALINTFPSSSYGTIATSVAITGVSCAGSESDVAECDLSGISTISASCPIMAVICSGMGTITARSCLCVEYLLCYRACELSGLFRMMQFPNW